MVIFVCMFSAIISVEFRVCFNPLQMGMFLKGLCTSYLACLSFLCGEICKTERIKHTLDGCHSAKPKFWLSSPHRSAAVTQKSVTLQAKFASHKSYTTNLKSPSGQRQNCPHEQGSCAYSLRVVIQGSVMVSCHWVLLLATKAMLE